MSTSFNIEFLVYIAGVWVPAKSVAVQSAFNSLPMATISLPADPRFFGVGREDRVPVHIFVKDTFTGTQNYMLFFEGEIKTFSYTNSAVTREITVNAQSNLAFLMDVKAFFMQSIEDISELEFIEFNKERGFSSFNAVTFPASLFTQGIVAPSSDTIIEYPSEFLDNLYNYLQNAGSMNQYNDSALANFYSDYTTRLKLRKRAVKVPIFDDTSKWPFGFPLLKGMQEVTALEQIMNTATEAQGRGKLGDTLYNWLNHIVGEMQYEMAFIHAPAVGTNMSGEDSIGFSMLKPMLYESPPPNCNVICKSHVSNIRTTEDVYQVPTRIMVDDTRGTMAKIMGFSNSAMEQSARMSFYPSVSGGAAPASEFADQIIPSEEYTGPYLYETHPPAWTSYIDYHNTSEGQSQELLTRIMRYLLQLKIYERRSLTASIAFNPFVVTGFPAVVFDSDNGGFVFAGYLMSVTHRITKTNCRTDISLGFTRTIEEAIDTPIHNPEEEVDEITRSVDDCGDIYQSIIGASRAVDFSEVEEWAALGNEDPDQAYSLNSRDIITLEQFATIMGIQARMEDDGYGGEFPLDFIGDYITDRRNPKLRDTLLEIAHEYLEEKVY